MEADLGAGGRSVTPRRVLVTSLGTAAYRPVTYHAEGREHTTRFAPAATAAIEGGCDAAILLLTEAAQRANGPALAAELRALGAGVEIRWIPEGQSERDVWAIFQTTVDALRTVGGVEVVLDVTYAFRHLTVVLFASLAYVSAASLATIRRIRYGALEAGANDRAPLLDLTPLLTLVDAQHAARQFVETGDARRLGAVLESLNRQLWTGGAGSPAFSRAARRVADVSAALSLGLPLETGLSAGAARAALDEVDFTTTYAPVAEELTRLLRRPLERFGVSAQNEKSAMALTREELDRQLQVIRFYFDAGAYDRVLLLLREWMVSRAILAAGCMDGWLSHGRTRARFERALNALVERHRASRHAHDGRGDGAEDDCAAVWTRVRELRNPLAHGGMCEEEVRPQVHRDRVRQLVEQCAARLEDDEWWRLKPRGAIDVLLVTALGLSPGVLYSGLRGCAPARALVVTSADAGRLVPEASAAAHYNDACVTCFTVGDPHRCFGEREAVLAWARPYLLTASTVVVNVTGGTTAMQYLVETVGRQAERLGLAVQRIALIDRRSPEIQRVDPYVQGELVTLEEFQRSDGDV